MFAKKSLGQNFLMHRQTGERIVHAANLSKDAVVLEIGPGTGMLTRELLTQVARVVAVEADGTLVEELRETFAVEIAEERLELIHADIRSFDASVIGETYHLVANIPYYITGEIIRQFLTEKHQPSSMTLLVQKEVAVRIARAEKESLLSLSVKVYGTPSYCFTVPRGAFVPAPNVDSAVLHIKDISRSSFELPEQETQFFTCIRAGFAHKRKRLAKNLEEYWDREVIMGAFEACTIAKDARAEELKLADWLQLARELN
ncbi:ribosomal RNA small subunit methyltransferase A [Patescibacteria group bacterium]|nr:ribosomal RNA small subunit methyltransferase A [Patescibacteria group bacterium]MBU2158634.1 ribosomal RNA small subunit methyltransferase A [Patescibacteria group bacterium]MBU2220587.1 ribosomal RNA small subunit methyltransferase A [Patescibacteria group bacterium]